MSHSHRQMQDNTTYLARISAQVGLKIDKKKTKILLLVKDQSCLRDSKRPVESFRYLGSIVDTRGGTDANVKTRISKARAAFHIFRNVWKSSIIGKTTKIRLFNTNVKSVLLYGAETWRMNKTTLKRINTFVNQWLRKILGIQWMDKVSNKDLWERTSQKNTWRRDLEADITQTGLSWKQLERIAQDRRRWRDVVHGLCSRRSQGPK